MGQSKIENSTVSVFEHIKHHQRRFDFSKNNIILYNCYETSIWAYDPGHKIRSVRVDGEQTESRNSTLFCLKFNTIKITIESFCGRRTTVFRNKADELSIFFAPPAWKPCTKCKGRSIQRPCSTIYARVRCPRWETSISIAFFLIFCMRPCLIVANGKATRHMPRAPRAVKMAPPLNEVPVAS